MPPKKLQPSNLLVLLPPDGSTGDDVVGEGTDDDACVVVDVDDELVLHKKGTHIKHISGLIAF